MAPSKRTVGILISIVLSLGMVSLAFYLSGHPTTPSASAESTEEILRAYASLDTDGDGLFDWQESLYGADPKNPNSLDPKKTDREMVDSGEVKPKFTSDTSSLEDPMGNENLPGIAVSSETLTDRFSRQLLQDYLTGNGTGKVPTEDDLIAFVNTNVDKLLKEGKTKQRFTSKDLVLAPEAPDAFLTYAVAVETMGKAQGIGVEKSELFYFTEAVQAGDTKALANVRFIGDVYGKLATAYSKIPVPQKLTSSHLRVANALARMNVVVGNMGAFDTDPLLALVGLSAYEETAIELVNAFSELYQKYVDEGVLITSEGPGAGFYQIIEDAHTRSKQ